MVWLSWACYIRRESAAGLNSNPKVPVPCGAAPVIGVNTFSGVADSGVRFPHEVFRGGIRELGVRAFLPCCVWAVAMLKLGLTGSTPVRR